MTAKRAKEIREKSIQIKGMFSPSNGFKEIDALVVVLCNFIIELTDEK